MLVRTRQTSAFDFCIDKQVASSSLLTDTGYFRSLVLLKISIQDRLALVTQQNLRYFKRKKEVHLVERCRWISKRRLLFKLTTFLNKSFTLWARQEKANGAYYRNYYFFIRPSKIFWILNFLMLVSKFSVIILYSKSKHCLLNSLKTNWVSMNLSSFYEIVSGNSVRNFYTEKPKFTIFAKLHYNLGKNVSYWESFAVKYWSLDKLYYKLL